MATPDEPPDTPPKKVTIKCGLQSSLQLPALVPVIERAVKFVSVMSVRGSRLANGFLIDAFLRGQLPPLDDKNERSRFVNQVFKMGFGLAARLPVPGLADWYSQNAERYESPPEDLPPRTKEIADYACSTYLTCFENNLWMHHESRLRKYIRATLTDDEMEVETLRFMITRTTGRRLASIAPTFRQQQFIDAHRAAFGLNGKSVMTETVIKRHLGVALLSSLQFLAAVEAHNVAVPPGTRGALRTWTAAPLCNRKRHNVTIDSKVLFHMMKDVGELKESTTFEEFWPVARDHFESIFVVTRKTDRNYKRRHSHGPSNQLAHCCYVQTDGVVLNAQFTSATAERIKGGNRALKKRKAEQKKLSEGDGDESPLKVAKSAKGKRVDAKRHAFCYNGNESPDAEMYSCDPGRVNILYFARLRDGKRFRLTRGEYRHRGGIADAEETWKKWNEPLLEGYAALSESSPKTSDIESWNRFLAVEATLATQLWAVLYARRASRLRFDTHCKKKRCLQSFLSQLGRGLGDDSERKRRVRVGFGQAKFASTGRGEMAVPTTQAFVECARMWKTTLVDENRSTVVCHDCHGRLSNVKIHTFRPGASRKDNRAVHRCATECGASGRALKHREHNAALNIGDIFVAMLRGDPRPLRYTREGAPV